MSKKIALPKMARHPHSAIFPEFGDVEYAALKASIENEGLVNPIYTYEGKILDGWNRARAIWELGLKIDQELVIEYDPQQDGGGNAKEWVIINNLHRRQLTAEEKIRLYDEHADVKLSAVKLAEKLNVNEKTVRRARSGKQEPDKPKVKTLETLQKERNMVLGRLASIDAQIAALQSVAKPAPKRTIARRK